MRKFCLVVLVLVASIAQAQKTYYVSNDGSNQDNDGLSENTPFETIAHAVSQFGSSESGTVYLKEGIYHEEVVVDGKNNIQFKPVDNANVVINGTIDIASNFEKVSNNIYRTAVDEPVWQLFVDDQEMIKARWPNTSFENDAIFIKYNWGHGSASQGGNGRMVDITRSEVGNISELEGIDLVGALVVANVGSFRTFTKRLTSNVVNSAFDYEQVPNGSYRNKEHFYFIEGKLALLDATNEWFYNVENGQGYVYLYSENDNINDFNNIKIKGKTQSFAFEIKNASNITVEGFKFFGTTVAIYKSSNVTIKNNIFSYPSTSRRMLGAIHAPLVTNVNQVIDVNNENVGTLASVNSSNCVFSGNVFEHTEGEALIFKGNGHKVHNNYFHHIDYSCADIQSIGLSIYNAGADMEFHNNTMHTTGASATLNLGARASVKYNDISNTGHAQSDGSIVQITKTIVEGSETAYNWLHDTEKYGFRFDAVIGDAGSAGQKGLAHHNVIWNIGKTNDPYNTSKVNGGIGMMIKGDYQEIYNNTVFNCAKTDILIFKEAIKDDNNVILGYTNEETRTFNNLADRISSSRTNTVAFDGYKGNNYFAGPGDNNNSYAASKMRNATVTYDAANVLTNNALYDFRPVAGSDPIDGGLVIDQLFYSPLDVNVTAGYQNLPDAGAYESENNTLWIPGIDFSPTTYPWSWPGEIVEVYPDSHGFINRPSFEQEDAIDFWNVSGTGIVKQISETEYHPGLGSKSLFITAPNTNWDGSSNKTLQNNAVVKSDTEFVFDASVTDLDNPALKVSFWIKVDADQDNGALDRIKLVIKDKDANGDNRFVKNAQIVIGDANEENYLSASTGWKKMTFAWTGIPFYDNYNTHVELWLGNLSGNVYLDDFESYIVDQSSLSNDVFELSKTFMIYPQPAQVNGFINIDSDSDIESFDLYDVSGRLIKQYQGNLKRVKVPNVLPGIYFIKILTEDGKMSSKPLVFI